MIKEYPDGEGPLMPKVQGVIIDMMHIVLLDDDPLFLEQTRTQIHKILKRNNLDAIIETFKSTKQLTSEQFADWDFCFLDIDFSEKDYTGIDIARKIRQVRQDSVLIFLTNYIEFAPEGYEVQAFRYLLKSVVSQKLEKYLLDGVSFLQEQKQTIQFRLSGESVTIALQQILYIESQKHTAIIYVQDTNGKINQYKLFTSLSSLEQQLSPRGFLRIQKSYLANMRRIQRLKCSEAIMDNGLSLSVSEKRYSELKAKYLLWKERC